jgi:hypothetical protein
MQVRQDAAPHLFAVESETEPEKWYQVFANGTVIKCTCKGYLSHKHCKHLTAVQQHLQQTEGAIEAEELSETSPSPNGSIAKWIKKIHGKDFIQYEGLLALAHEQGLTTLGAGFISVTSDLAIAYAWAEFKDGRTFWEAGDATPDNVHHQVRPHFARVALTRAKARVLRDALNIGVVAVEELGDGV